MDLNSKITMYLTSTMTSPVTKTAKMSKWLRLDALYQLQHLSKRMKTCSENCSENGP